MVQKDSIISVTSPVTFFHMEICTKIMTRTLSNFQPPFQTENQMKALTILTEAKSSKIKQIRQWYCSVGLTDWNDLND